jgi:hypothetical protein
MNIRKLVLVAMLTASLCAARKKQATHLWQAGTLLAKIPVSWLGDFDDRDTGIKGKVNSVEHGRIVFAIQGHDSVVFALLTSDSYQYRWAEFFERRPAAELGPRQPAILGHGPLKYSIETVPCRLGECGYKMETDKYGRPVRTKITTATYVYVLDEEGYVFRLIFVNERANNSGPTKPGESKVIVPMR